MRELKTAGRRRERATKNLTEASVELADAIRRARASGMMPSAIAEEASCSRQHVYNVLEGRER